ncbi:hypothetical protein GCM10020366_33770 [Saccharopolyspora gregorii]|uniref:Uncharacterized protein n=1 Tax=Saccharopolyspora gregorii TaxID=33914 RepID=A0ABP6RTC2_9PSEU
MRGGGTGRVRRGAAEFEGASASTRYRALRFGSGRAVRSARGRAGGRAQALQSAEDTRAKSTYPRVVSVDVRAMRSR